MAQVAAANSGIATRPLTPQGPLIFGSVLSLALGAAYMSGTQALFPLFMSVSVFVLLGALLWTGIGKKDWLNPIVLLIASATLRIGLPWLLVVFSEPPLGFAWLSPAFDYWEKGLGLATFGILSVVLGWLVAPSRWIARAANRTASVARKFEIDVPVFRMALLFMAVGVVLVTIFLTINYQSPIEAVQTGVIHDSEQRVAGTSRYNLLAGGFLVYGSVTATMYLLFKRKKRLIIGLAPVIIASVVFSTFGGRVVALAPLVLSLLAVWYRRSRAHVSAGKALLGATALLLIGTVYASFVLSYRFGGGIEGGLQAITPTGLLNYVNFAIWYESGFLHPFALATYFGSGVLGAGTFVGIGGFVTEVFLGMETVRPGAYMVSELLDFPDAWGFHTGLIIDLYMSVGLLGVVMGGLLFGVVLRVAYESFRRNQKSPVVMLLYAVTFWHLLWVFYESITTLFTLFISLLFVFLLLGVGRVLRPKKATAPRLRGPAPVTRI